MVLAALGVGLSACSPARPPVAGASPTPSSHPTAAPVQDFNGRLGSNRLAAVAASALGRRLYAGGQYWEVYVRTQPATLPGKYDPGDPGGSAPAAAMVTSADVVMASESSVSVKAFTAGGEAHERQVLMGLDEVLRQAFPNLAGDSIRVFFGESFQRGVATFDHGKLVTYEVKKSG